MTPTEMNATLTEMIRGPWEPTRCRVCGFPLDKAGEYCRPDNCSMRPWPERRADSPIDYASPTGFVMALEWAAEKFPTISISNHGDGWCAHIGDLDEGNEHRTVASHYADSPAVALRAALCEARERGLI